MHGSHRFWTAVGGGAVLALLAPLFGRPAPLIGAAAIAAWLLATQVIAVRGFRRADRELTVDYSIATERTSLDTPVRVMLRASGDIPRGTELTVTAPIPTGAHGPSAAVRTVTLSDDNTAAETMFELRFPVAGRFTIDRPRVDLTETQGLFTETFSRGDPPTVTVDPHGPADIHVGQSGKQVAAAYGDHDTGQHGAGLTPEDLREYVADDPADSIDWKATARLGTPYVREFDAESDRQTVLVVDQRAAMNAASVNGSKLDYAREVALSITATAIRNSDPLGFYGVGDEGIATRIAPGATASVYTRIRSHLQTLDATTPRRTRGGTQTSSPARAQTLQAVLRTDDSQFATRLRPFLDPVAYVEQLADDPLVGAVRSAQRRVTGTQWTVLVTDDTEPERVRAAARLAASGGDPVLVFLTPSVLYESAELSSPDAAYDRYLTFEEFRRDLDRLPQVAAFEVGPGDRIDRLLAARRARTTSF